MKDLFSFQSSAVPETARLLAFRGHEALCRPYEFQVHFLLFDEADFDMADAIGSKATLCADRADGRPKLFIHGGLASVEHLYEVDNTAMYRAVVVPRLWLLGQTKHSRVFTQMTVPDIVRAVLEDGGLAPDEFELRLDRDYPVEEHVCQYKESDLDFIHRWMELEGLYYFFEHRDEHEVLVITDHRSFHDALDAEAVRYRPVAGEDRSAGECFDSFTCQHVALPERVRVCDYDYARPNLEVAGMATVTSTGVGEVVVHGARVFDPARGQRIAQGRAEELKASQVVYHAAGRVLRVRTGYTFQLDEHGRQTFNTKYLATELSHFGNQAASSPELRKLAGVEYDDVYRVEVRAIRADVQFRPRQSTPWPRVHGLEGAVVDGEGDSQYAQIDEQGRYRVKLHFDESDSRDGKASTYVRMVQPHGGTVEGWHFPLRKGTEVVIAFLGGDPDRPVIAGVAPNARTPSPVTGQNHTTNVIQTGGGNRIELEDHEGSQRITISSPTKNSFLRMGAPNDDSNIMMTTDGNKRLRVGGNLTVATTGHKVETVGKTALTVIQGSNIENYNADHETVVKGGQSLEIKGGASHIIESGARFSTTGGEVRAVTGGYEFHADTVLRTANTVTEEYGPLNQTIASQKTFIKGGAVVTSPAGYTVVAPGGITELGAKSLKVVPNMIQILGTRVVRMDADVKTAHLILASSGLKFDNHLVKIDICGPYIQQRGPEIVSSAIKYLNSATDVNLSGLHLYP